MTIASVGPAMVRADRRRLRTQGFTLMEMLIVVAIIGVTAALAAPAMHASIMERKNSEAALDLVRLARRGRAEALSYGRAYLIRFDGTTPGSFRLYRGISSDCNAPLNDWAALTADPCGGTGACVDRVDMADSDWSLGGSSIRAVERGTTALVDVCFEPRGTVEHRTDVTARFSSINTVAGGYLFDFARYASDSLVGATTRTVLIPLGSDARVL